MPETENLREVVQAAADAIAKANEYDWPFWVTDLIERLEHYADDAEDLIGRIRDMLRRRTITGGW